MEIILSNERLDLVGFQMDLILPDGISIDKAGCGLSSRITDEKQELVIGKLESGGFRLTSTSMSLTPIHGTEGVLLSLKLNSGKNFVQGEATIGNIIFSTSESERISMDDVSFTINTQYSLTYMVDGEEYQSFSIKYGERITPLKEPSKDGYTFSGWSEIPETMPAHDVTVTGSFSIKLAKSIKLDKDAIIFSALQSQKLSASLIPTDLINKTVTWSSANSGIAIVDKNGVVTPIRNGETYIIVNTTDGSELKDSCKVTVDIQRMFEAAATQTTLTIRTKSGQAVAKNLKVKVDGKIYDLFGTDAKITGLAPNKAYHIIATAIIDGYTWTEEFDVTTMDIRVVFESEVTPTTIDISASYDAGDATVTHAGFDRGMEQHSISLKGLEPNQLYEYVYYITTEEGGTATYKAQVRTGAVQMKISRTKIVAVGDVVIVASSNIVEEDDGSVGIEWRRYDWPDEIESKSGVAYLYETTIEGSVKNLNAEKFWKIRPFFQSKSGNRFYGDWVTIDPSDASYFEPSVHTYNSINVSDNTAELKGFVMEGTDNVTKQGFMYWKSESALTRRYARRIPANAIMVEVTGNRMVATLEDLDFDTEYCYVAFVMTSDNETFYGDEQTFKTREATPDEIDGIGSVIDNDDITGIACYDIQGRKLPALQKGLNIIRMKDGTVKKIIFK